MTTRNEKRLAMTKEELEKIVAYDPETGIVTWKQDRTTGKGGSRTMRLAGKEAGHLRDNGYRVVSINYCAIYTHRLAWFLVHGQWPRHELDHIDTDRSNNRITNLRPANGTQNRANTGRRSHNRTGFKGVTTMKGVSGYTAQISVGGVTRYLGRYRTAEQAHKAYCKAAQKAFGEFARAS